MSLYDVRDSFSETPTRQIKCFSDTPFVIHLLYVSNLLNPSFYLILCLLLTLHFSTLLICNSYVYCFNKDSFKEFQSYYNNLVYFYPSNLSHIRCVY